MKELMTTIKRGVNFLLSRIVAVFLIVMTIMVLYQIFTRYVLNNPSDFTEEVVRYLLIWTGFTGAAYGFSTRQHMALIFLKEKLKGNVQKSVSAFLDILILLFALLVLVIGGSIISYSTMGELSALLGFPRGIVYMIGPISGVFIVAGQIVNIWEDLTGNIIEVEEDV